MSQTLTTPFDISMAELEASAEQVPYAIPGNETGGRLMVYGNKNAPNILLFCTGFPDNVFALMPMASRLAAENDCLCGVACMPGYDVHHESWKPQGYTFEEVVVALREATRVFKSLSTNDQAELSGVFHDWGVYVGSILTNRVNEEAPGTFSKIIYLDILPPVDTKHNVPKQQGLSKKTLIMLGYTSVLAVAHAAQRHISRFLAAPIFVVGNLFLQTFGLLPTRSLDQETLQNHKPQYSIEKQIYMAYPYYNLYFGKRPSPKEFHLPENIKETPVLFMYGMDKNAMFHDPNHLEWLEKETGKVNNKSKVVPVDHAGHWLYLHQPEICYEEAKSFLFDS